MARFKFSKLEEKESIFPEVVGKKKREGANEKYQRQRGTSMSTKRIREGQILWITAEQDSRSDGVSRSAART